MSFLDADLAHRPDWHRQAMCRGGPVAPWFPERHESGQAAARAEMMETCAKCPVELDCLAAGIREHAGVWAGTSPSERKTLRGRGVVARRDGVTFTFDKSTGVVEKIDDSDSDRDDLAG